MEGPYWISIYNRQYLGAKKGRPRQNILKCLVSNKFPPLTEIYENQPAELPA